MSLVSEVALCCSVYVCVCVCTILTQPAGFNTLPPAFQHSVFLCILQYVAMSCASISDM